MRVLVCGGRNFSDYNLLHDTLEGIHNSTPISCIIHGNCAGADRLANIWADLMDISIARFPAEWSKYGRKAGPIRNALMLREGKPDLVVGFPGGTGTANMLGLAETHGFPFIKVEGEQNDTSTQVS